MLIVIAEDEAGVRHSLEELLKLEHELILCEDGECALKVLEKHSVDLVLSDQQMPKMTGLELLQKTKEISPQTSFILMTAFGSIKQAVEAIRLGAEDYFTKPFDLAEVEHRIRRVDTLRAWRIEEALKSEFVKGVERLIGESAAIRAACEFVKKVGSVPLPILLLGPSGSGKEVVARAIHETSNKCHRPFIPVNCASLGETLMESELFGHEKGAFTGAVSAKPGKFELANQGSLFLDEIGDLPLAVQAKLLRVLQEKEFYRVGGIRQIRTNARVIAATHRNLKEMVRTGAFREDLFFRLNVLTFELPPLSQRRGDIAPLIHYFWKKLSDDFGRKSVLTTETIDRLVQYDYPGNVRELINILERLMVLSTPQGTILPSALPPEFHSPSGSLHPTTPIEQSWRGKTLEEAMDEVEANIVRWAMHECEQNQVRTAELLKISRGALQYRLRKHGLMRTVSLDTETEKAA